MKEQQLGMEEKREQRYTEMRVLILYTLYSVAMITAAVSLDWDRWIIPIILTAGAVAWGTYLKDYRTYRYRSFLVTVLAMMNFIIYGICAVEIVPWFLPGGCQTQQKRRGHWPWTYDLQRPCASDGRISDRTQRCGTRK